MDSLPRQHQWETHPSNPFNWALTKKWRVISISCLLTFLASFNSTAITTAFPEISQEFGIDNTRFEYTFFTVTAWNLAAAIIPKGSLPMMDTRGTYWIYNICYAIFIIFVIPQAWANSFTTLVVVRAVAGAVGGTIQNATEGVAANLFKTSRERLPALTVYIFSLLSGVTLGPVQGAVVGTISWRWVFWIQLILYCAAWPLLIFCTEETRGPVIHAKLLRQQQIANNEDEAKGSMQAIEHTGGTAWIIIKDIGLSAKLLVTEPIVFFFMLWCAFSFGLIYISTESIALVFIETFGFAGYQTGLVQISMLVGEILGLVACLWSNAYYANSANQSESSSINGHETHATLDETKAIPVEGNGKPIPEHALHFSVPATVMFLSGGLFVYGWTCYQYLPWIAPSVGLAMQGFAIQIIVTAVTIYITDSYERFAATAIAGIAVGENVFAAFLPLASLPMYRTLGFQWASSLLAFLALAVALAPVALIWKGRSIREKSKAIRAMTWA